MTLQGVTFQGPPLKNLEKIERLPDELIELLWQINGFVAYAGGLHLRGMVDEPGWHSFERYRSGEMALSKLFSAVENSDLPFGQDFLGNQFVLRDSEVWKLRADTGEIRGLDVELAGFFEAVRRDPIAYLRLDLLAEYHDLHGMLEPGELVHTMPPLAMRRDGRKPALKSAPVDNALSFLANFARQIADVPEGEVVNLRLFIPQNLKP